MIQDVEIVRFQLARLAGLPRYPKDPVARNELVRTACECTAGVSELKRAVDGILANWDRCPIPSELRKAIIEMQPAKQKPRCEECGGSGYISKTYLVTRDTDPDTGRQRKCTETITEAQRKDLESRGIGWDTYGKQFLCIGAHRCTHGMEAA